ncbi:hypothetical protein F4809DRAFT_637926 [Biscogniauxia mediterranea]|nr:hypothetical protein F4809DRAFT_637926 [Biscogniauxia mediterranea]
MKLDIALITFFASNVLAIPTTLRARQDDTPYYEPCINLVALCCSSEAPDGALAFDCSPLSSEVNSAADFESACAADSKIDLCCGRTAGTVGILCGGPTST